MHLAGPQCCVVLVSISLHHGTPVVTSHPCEHVEERLMVLGLEVTVHAGPA